MGDENGGHVGLPLDTADLLPCLEAQPCVQIGQRLIQQQHPGTLHQRAGDGHALLLAAGQLTGLAVHQPFQLHQLCRLQRPLRHLHLCQLIRAPQVFQREHDVLPYRQVGVQRVVLEHQPHAAILRRQMGHIVLAEEDLSLRRLQQAADQVQRRAFAAAGGAQQTDELPIGDLKGEVMDGDDVAARFFVAVGESLGQMLQHDLHGSFSLPVFDSPPPCGRNGLSVMSAPLYHTLRRKSPAFAKVSGNFSALPSGACPAAGA